MKFKREVATAILRDLLTSSTPINEVGGVSVEEFTFHVNLLVDAGFIKLDPCEEALTAERVTWEGYSHLYEFDESLGKEFDPKNFIRYFPRA